MSSCWIVLFVGRSTLCPCLGNRDHLTEIDSTNVFYDAANGYFNKVGSKERYGLRIRGAIFNPIRQGLGTSAIDIRNTFPATVSDCVMIGSVGLGPSTRWLFIDNCVVEISGNWFGYGAPAAAYIKGCQAVVKNNWVGSVDGFTFAGGVIEAAVNKFYGAGSGYLVSPGTALNGKLGPDYFGSACVASYNLQDADTITQVEITYDKAHDFSVNKFLIAAAARNLRIRGSGQVLQLDETGTFDQLDTGKMYVMAGSADMTWLVPPPVPGCELTIYKPAAITLVLNTSSANKFSLGTGSTKTQLTSAAANIGALVKLRGYSNSDWVVESLVGTWTSA